jgi:hypothetical protein
MYLASIVLLMLVLPAAGVIVEALWFGSAADVVLLVGKSFVFWAVGVRLFIAGVRQVAQPQFTAESIFEIKDRAAFGIVRSWASPTCRQVHWAWRAWRCRPGSYLPPSSAASSTALPPRATRFAARGISMSRRH